MRKLLLILLLSLLPGVAGAQMFGPAVFTAAPSGGGSYTGPADVGVTLTDCWGAQLCKASYAGSPLVNVCLTTNHTTCGDVLSDTTGGLRTSGSSSLATIGCTTDDTSCEYATFYSQLGGCNLVASSGHRARVQSTTTRNGHVSVGVKDDADFYSCNESTSATTSATMIGIVSGEAAFSDGSCAANGGTAGTFAFGLENQAHNVCQFGVFASTTTVYSIFAQSSAVNVLSGGTAIPSGLYCAISQGATTSSAIQGVINGTGDTAANASTAWNNTIAAVMGSTASVIDSWLGDVDVWAFIAPSVNNTNAGTVAHNMAQFWTGTGSPKC